MTADRYITAADPRVRAICGEFGVKTIGAHLYPVPGETRAVATIRRIIDRYGEAHARLVLSTLTETEGNAGLLDEVSLWAASDLVRAYAYVVEHRTSEWLAAWDRMPMGELMWQIQELRGVVPLRAALVGLCHAYLRQILGDGCSPMRRQEIAQAA